jgi:Zn ribbon nucleic-acid-binding protein
MPIPNLNIIKYKKVEDEGRTCPVCNAQLMYFSDEFKSLFKCFNCGYSRRAESHISGQTPYDFPLLLVGSLSKLGWFELRQPIDEQLYNALITKEWLPEDAISAVIKDLELMPEEAQYFIQKVKFLED